MENKAEVSNTQFKDKGIGIKIDKCNGADEYLYFFEDPKITWREGIYAIV